MTTQETRATVASVKPLLVAELLKRKAALAASGGTADDEVTVGDVSMMLAEISDDVIAPAIEQLLTEMPQAAELPPEQLNELLAQALAEVIAEAAG